MHEPEGLAAAADTLRACRLLESASESPAGRQVLLHLTNGALLSCFQYALLVLGLSIVSWEDGENHTTHSTDYRFAPPFICYRKYFVLSIASFTPRPSIDALCVPQNAVEVQVWKK